MTDERLQEHILQFFTWQHLPAELQVISKPFCMLARDLMTLPRNPERSVEAKDAAVRAALADAVAIAPQG